MNKELFKRNLIALVEATENLDKPGLAKAMGVSRRTLDRYLSPTDPSIPDGAGLVGLLFYLDVPVERLLPSDPYAGNTPEPPRFGPRLGSRVIRRMVDQGLALLILDRKFNVVYCTHTFAALYEMTPAEMIGGNTRDLAWYADDPDRYGWIPEQHRDNRINHIETLMALAEEYGQSSNIFWFVAPDGLTKRVLIRCFHMDGLFLFIDICTTDAADGEDRVVHRAAEDELIIQRRGLYVPQSHWRVLERFMRGWSNQHIAVDCGIPREAVHQILETWRSRAGHADLEALQESIWEHSSQDSYFDPAQMIRVNCHALC